MQKNEKILIIGKFTFRHFSRVSKVLCEYTNQPFSFFQQQRGRSITKEEEEDDPKNPCRISIIYKTWRTNRRIKQNNHHRHRPLKPPSHSLPPPTCTFQPISSSPTSSLLVERSNDQNISSHGGHASFLFTSLTKKIISNFVHSAVSFVTHSNHHPYGHPFRIQTIQHWMG